MGISQSEPSRTVPDPDPDPEIGPTRNELGIGIGTEAHCQIRLA